MTVNGVSSDQDNQWHDTYTNVFTAPSLQVPWYAILGNHDYYGNPDAQIAYYKNHRDNRWYMPDHNYSVVYNLPTDNPEVNATLELVCIDTALISIEENPVTSPGGEKYVSPERTAEYLKAVEQMLSRSTATWLIVAGHYTIYSVADHGNNDVLIDKLVPLLRKYNVQAYFNGHDHVLQHIESDGISYFTSGHGTHRDNFPAGSYAARLAEHLSAINSPVFKFGSNGPGFATAKATAQEMKIQFIDRFGGVLYATQLSNPRIFERNAGLLVNRPPIVWRDTIGENSNISSWPALLGIAGCLVVALVLVFGRPLLWKAVSKVCRLCSRKDTDLSLSRLENGVKDEPPPHRGFTLALCEGYKLNTAISISIGVVLLLLIYFLPHN